MEDILLRENITCCLMQETWEKKSENNENLFKSYVWFSKYDKSQHIWSGRRGLGVLLKKDCAANFAECFDRHLTTNNFCLWCKIMSGVSSRKCWYICNIYIPPAMNRENTFDEILTKLTMHINYILSKKRDSVIIFGGDFNSHVGELFIDNCKHNKP